MTTKEKMIEDILERLKDYEDDTGIIEIGGNQLRLLLKEYLQEPTEEREVELKQYEGKNLYGKYKYGNCICGNYTLGEFDKYCPRCGAKIKRID